MGWTTNETMLVLSWIMVFTALVMQTINLKKTQRELEEWKRATKTIDAFLKDKMKETEDDK